MKSDYIMLKASALLCPRAARALSIGHGQCGHLPVEIFSGTGRAGIGNIAGGRAKAGTGMPVAHHYCGGSFRFIIHT